MAIENADGVLTVMVALIHDRLSAATETAKAAKACAGVSNLDEAIRITLDIEQPIYEVTTLLNAATLIRRLSAGDS